mmetsp:Transcript_65155/g.174712  ORF Transcript_65155/g.174712 Transcript_65155/m.174712 type:complete len:285 (+) Transcript_65155:1283-2137(+)
MLQHQHTTRLPAKRAVGCEQPNTHGAQEPADAMHREGTDDIVKLHPLFPSESNPIRSTCDYAHNDCAVVGEHMRPCRNGHQSSQDGIADVPRTQLRVALTAIRHNHVHDAHSESRKAGSQSRVQRHVSNKISSCTGDLEGTTATETVPRNPEEKGTEQGLRRITGARVRVAQSGLSLGKDALVIRVSILSPKQHPNPLVLDPLEIRKPPDPRSQHHDADHRAHSAQTMRQTRTRKIDEPSLEQPPIRVPRPMTCDGVDHPGGNDRQQDISVQIHSLRDCAAVDG